MSFSLIPKFLFRNLTDIPPDFLVSLGIKFLMVDLDNTVAAYNEHSVSDLALKWFESVRNHDIDLFIISNSTRTDRVEAFAKELGTGFVMNARKPSPSGLRKAMGMANYSTDVSALAGDQIFTDTIAAGRAGVVSIIVRPKRFTNPFLALRYYIEFPFRLLCKNKK